jgi:hypothetical protein
MGSGSIIPGRCPLTCSPMFHIAALVNLPGLKDSVGESANR